MDISEIRISIVAGSSLPKYRQLALGLEQLLLGGAIGAGERLPGDRELAAHLGTSTVTVSKALNELAGRGLLRRKVGCGTFAGFPGEPSCRRIGIICHEIVMPDSAYITPLLNHFYGYWEERGYQVVTLRGGPEDYRQLFQEWKLAGMMVMVPREEFFPSIGLLQAAGLPVVSIGFACPDLPLISFGTNHEKTAEESVAYLHGLGHRRIGYISFSDSSSNVIHGRGYRKGMWAAGLPIHPDWELGLNRRERFAEDLQALFGRSEPPTAFLIAEIHMVIRMYNILHQIGVSIPGDVSIVGFDDPAYLTEINPPLTVFRQHLEEFSGQAARQLENQVLGRLLEQINHDNINSILVRRGSCRPLTP